MTDHVLDAIDAALNAWETSDDAMRCSYADTLPPVEERDTQRPSTEGVDVSHWPEGGWTTDTPEVFERLGQRLPYHTRWQSTPHQWGLNFAADARMSMLLHGSIFVEHGGGEARVVPPESVVTVTGPDGQVVARGANGRVVIPVSGRYELRQGAHRLAHVDMVPGGHVAVRAERNGYKVYFVVIDEAVADQPEQETPRERALKARLNRHTGPQQNRHRHRGL